MRRLTLLFALLAFALPASAGNPGGFVLRADALISGGADPTHDAYGDYNAAYFIYEISSIGAGQTVVPRIYIYDPAQDAWVSTANQPAMTANGTYIYTVGPGADAAIELSTPHQQYDLYLPRAWRLMLVTTNTEDVTVSVSVIPLASY